MQIITTGDVPEAALWLERGIEFKYAEVEIMDGGKRDIVFVFESWMHPDELSELDAKSAMVNAHSYARYLQTLLDEKKKALMDLDVDNEVHDV